LKTALGRIDHLRWRRGIEHAQEREAEAGRLKAAQLDIAAVPVGRVLTPPLNDALSAVRLTDVLAPIAGVGDQVDAGNRTERGTPRGVPMFTNDGLEFQ